MNNDQLYFYNRGFNDCLAKFVDTHPVNPKYDSETGEPLIDGYPLFSGLPHPVKELTDEEIYRLLADSIWAVGLNTDCLDEQNWADGITVARAILRKAQEK